MECPIWIHEKLHLFNKMINYLLSLLPNTVAHIVGYFVQVNLKVNIERVVQVIETVYILWDLTSL